MKLSQSQSLATAQLLDSLADDPLRPIVLESMSGMGKSAVIDAVRARLGLNSRRYGETYRETIFGVPAQAIHVFDDVELNPTQFLAEPIERIKSQVPTAQRLIFTTNVGRFEGKHRFKKDDAFEPTVHEHLSEQGIEHTTLQLRALNEGEVNALINSTTHTITDFERELIQTHALGIPQLVIAMAQQHPLTQADALQAKSMYLNNYFSCKNSSARIQETVRTFTGRDLTDQDIPTQETRNNHMMRVLGEVMFKGNLVPRCAETIERYKAWAKCKEEPCIVLFAQSIPSELAGILRTEWTKLADCESTVGDLLYTLRISGRKTFAELHGNQLFCDESTRSADAVHDKIAAIKRKLHEGTDHIPAFIVSARAHSGMPAVPANTGFAHECLLQQHGVRYVACLSGSEKIDEQIVVYDPATNRFL